MKLKDKGIKRIAHRQGEFISRTYRKEVRTKSFGVLDFETYTLADGRQRAYYLLIYLPSVGYTHLRRCDYTSEEEFSFSSSPPRIYTDGTSIRRLKWKGSIFQDILRWTPPSSLSDMAKTWLGKDIKDVFPYDAVREDMILSKNSKFGTITYGHLSYKVKVYPEDIKRFSEGDFWDLSRQ
jgi:hypothetical protein